ESRGHHVIVRCAGNAPADFVSRKGVEFVGFINKHKDYAAFIRFLESCDVGCLFSEAEFSSISILEFISTGRPVAGYVVDGMGDLFLPGVSMRFDVSDPLKKITDTFEKYIVDENYRRSLNKSAVDKSEHVRWPRAVNAVLNILKASTQ
ncbi:MAG TPA: hypothetical protein VFE50_02310, partial [Cyclobacteriaceae bacterium]|nr:hypothetical protein [Cyclobacteriaceae bacterium]